MKTILVKGRFHKDSLKALEEAFPNKVLYNEKNEITKTRPEVEALIIRSKTIVNKNTLKHLPKLRYIVSGTSGFDHIDYKECHKHNIQVEYCPEANRVSAAELTWALISNSYRFLSSQSLSLSQNQWRGHQIGRELKGKSIFIIGFGRIGSLVAKYAEAFGLYISVLDPYKEIPSEYQKVKLEEGLKSADIISLHVPKTQNTISLIGKNEVKLMKEGSLLVNTSRGEVISKDAINKIIQDNHIFLGLDVFLKEPLPDNCELSFYDKALLSPHIGAYTEEAFQKASAECVMKVKNFLSGHGINHPVPPDEKWVKDL